MINAKLHHDPKLPLRHTSKCSHRSHRSSTSCSPTVLHRFYRAFRVPFSLTSAGAASGRAPRASAAHAPAPGRLRAACGRWVRPRPCLLGGRASGAGEALAEARHGHGPWWRPGGRAGSGLSRWKMFLEVETSWALALRVEVGRQLGFMLSTIVDSFLLPAEIKVDGMVGLLG